MRTRACCVALDQRRLRAFCILVWAVATLVATSFALADEQKSGDSKAATALKVGIYAGDAPVDLEQLRNFQTHVQTLTKKKLVPATVNVQVGSAQGSGVIISEDGYVLTAAHVGGKPNRNVVFVFADGKRARGVTLGLNRSLDAGLMKITDEGKWPHVEMGKSNQLKKGDWCLATGHPGGYQPGRTPVLRLGRVLAASNSVIVTDCTLVGGDSGGPLFDLDGRVIGINSRIGPSLSANMHVPVSTYNDTWDRLAKGEAWGNQPGVRPYVGVQGAADSEVARVAVVFPGTPAEKAGLMAGDVIRSFGGKDVSTFPAFVELVREKQPGEKVKLIVVREENDLTLTIQIGKRGG